MLRSGSTCLCVYVLCTPSNILHTPSNILCTPSNIIRKSYLWCSGHPIGNALAARHGELWGRTPLPCEDLEGYIEQFWGSIKRSRCERFMDTRRQETTAGSGPAKNDEGII